MICKNCNIREARPQRSRCNQCEKTDAENLAARPPLVDTGLLIDDWRSELIYPDGRREKLTRFASGPGKYFYEALNGGCCETRLKLRVLKEAS